MLGGAYTRSHTFVHSRKIAYWRGHGCEGTPPAPGPAWELGSCWRAGIMASWGWNLDSFRIEQHDPELTSTVAHQMPIPNAKERGTCDARARNTCEKTTCGMRAACHITHATRQNVPWEGLVTRSDPTVESSHTATSSLCFDHFRCTSSRNHSSSRLAASLMARSPEREAKGSSRSITQRDSSALSCRGGTVCTGRASGARVVCSAPVRKHTRTDAAPLRMIAARGAILWTLCWELLGISSGLTRRSVRLSPGTTM